MASSQGQTPDKTIKAMESLSLQNTVSQEPPPTYNESRAQERVATRTASSNRLQKPIAIPATTPKLGSPFLRAYPPSLEGFGLPKEVFLPLIDELNRVAVKNPPLQVLGLVNTFVGFVPIQGAQIASAAVGAATAIGTYAISKGRTEWFLRKANKEVFGPRGLKAEIGKVDALAKIANIPILNEAGKVDKETALLDPVQGWELTPKVSGQNRRLRAFEEWIAELDTEALPNVETSSNPFSKWSAAASEKQRQKGERKMLKSRRKAYKKGEIGVEDRHERRLAKLDRKRAEAEQIGDTKKLAKIERRYAKADRRLDKKLAKSDKAHMKNKEEKGTRKILWLIIRNVNADSGEGPDPYIEGPSDLSDSSSGYGSSDSSDSDDGR